MSVFDKAKGFAEKNSEKISEGIDKASKTIDEKTDGKYKDKVEKFGNTAKEKLRDASEGSNDDKGSQS